MSKRVLGRLLAPLMVIGGAVSVGTAQPALAGFCAQDRATVSFQSTQNGVLTRSETDPIDSPFYQIFVGGIGQRTFSFKLGSAGTELDENPFWDVYGGNGVFVGSFAGSTTGPNCVSNERTFSLIGSAGTTYLIYANYFTGNTGKTINNQHHFQVTFV